MFRKLYIFGTKFISLVIVFPFITAHSQTLQHDTLTVLNYNTDNYGFPATQSCPGLLTQSKHQYLRGIVQYVNPDIIGLTKMDATPASFTTDTVAEKVLNSVCPGCYDHATYTNISGYEKENMLYFKTAKLGFAGTTTIYSGDPNISDINMHKLYYKSADLAINHDTTFINVILAHLESGSGSASERATEITGAMSWLNAHITAPGNYIFMGDLNTQSSSEACFQSLINSSNANSKFYDPPNQLGDWANDPASFAYYLTQSTRVTDPGDCSATGGISYRYDHILCTQSIMQGDDSITYVPGSYHVIGQDGNHTGLALTDQPTNTSVPAQVLTDLYYMSEHLPVSVQLAITKSVIAGIVNVQHASLHIEFNNLVKDYLELKLSQGERIKTACRIEIYNEQGKLVSEDAFSQNEVNINTSSFSPGIYFLSICQLTDNAVLYSNKFIKISE